MKTTKFRILSIAGLAVATLAASGPLLARDFHEHDRWGHEHFVGRVVMARPAFVYRTAPVYYAAPAPVYYAPAPVYYGPQAYYGPPAYSPAGEIGGAIVGTAIGSTVRGYGRPGAIALGAVLGAVVGNQLATGR